MRIIEIRFPSDLPAFKKRKYPEALFPVGPVVSPFVNLRKRKVHVPQEEVYEFKRRLVPVPLIPAVPRITGTATIIGHGVLTADATLYDFAACILDSVVTLYLTPRAVGPQVLMPIAFITEVDMPNQSIACTGTTTTIPATGAFSTLVEGNSVPPVNQ